jgi:nucleolar complex protein 3
VSSSICSCLACDASQVYRLNELAELCQDSDAVVRQLAILSSVEVYKDILPGYRIRLLTPAEQSQKV